MRSEKTGGFGSASSGSLRIGSCTNRTVFPPGTTARIFRPGRSVMSSGTAGTKCWRVTFHGPGKRFVEPVMGWIGTTDPLAGLELKFPTLEAAVRYARRQGLDFVLDGTSVPSAMPAGALHQKDAPAVVQKQAA